MANVLNFSDRKVLMKNVDEVGVSEVKTGGGYVHQKRGGRCIRGGWDDRCGKEINAKSRPHSQRKERKRKSSF